MRHQVLLVVAGALLVIKIDCKTTYQDMFAHKHKPPLPFTILGWEPDTNSWDESLYPALPKGFNRRHGKVQVHLTSDSPAINGSLITFTAKLEFFKCQKEALSPLNNRNCNNAIEQVQNWTSWLDDYGFGKCTEMKHCNMFPDGKPFSQYNDWRRKGYVYVWHTMGQYYELCDGSSSSLTLNTTNWTLGGGMMEVLVYRKRERRKYIPLSTDDTVFWITDQIPLAVNIFQKEAINITERNTFIKGYDIIFNVQIHDPSHYLKTADAVDFIWDFHDGNQLITHSNIATHSYSMVGNVTVKLIVQAAFRTTCPPPAPTPKHFTRPFTTVTTPAPTTVQHVPQTTTIPTTETTDPEVITSVTMTTPPDITSTSVKTTEGETASINPTPVSTVQHSPFTKSTCFHYIYGNFEDRLFIVEQNPSLLSLTENRIVNVFPAKVTNTAVNFVVKCAGSIPTTACTIVADSTCRDVMSIVCDDVKPSVDGCQFSLKHTFQEPGTYCVNITLDVPGSLDLSTLTVTIGNSSDNNSYKSPGATEVVLSSTVVLCAIFGFIAFIVYRRNRMYRPVSRSMLEDAEGHGMSRSRLSNFRTALFSNSEERSHLLR